MKRWMVLVLTVVLGLATAEGLGFSGSLRTGLGLVFSDLNWDQAGVAFSLKGSYSLDDAEMIAELKADPGGVRLGEAVARVYLDDADLEAGRLVVSTGRTDFFSPLDAFNPRDLSFPLAAPEDLKAPVLGLAASYYPDDNTLLTALFSPVFAPSTPPAGRWARPMILPPGVVGVAVVRPEPRLENAVFGLRATTSLDVLEGLDLGFTALYTFTPFPAPDRLVYLADQDKDADPRNGPFRLVLAHEREAVVGGDFALVFSIPGVAEGVILRGEGAYVHLPTPEATDPLKDQKPKSYGEGVLELEYTFPDGPTAILLYDLKGNADGLSHRAGGILRYDADERTRLEGAALYNFSDGSGLLRPGVRYTLADGVEAWAQLAYFFGPADSEFGAWADNSQLRAGLDFSF